MKASLGFIQIPILLAIIVGLLAVGGVGYGIAKHKGPEKIEEETVVATTTAEVSTTTTELSELDQLKQEVAELKKQQKPVAQTKVSSEVVANAKSDAVVSNNVSPKTFILPNGNVVDAQGNVLVENKKTETTTNYIVCNGKNWNHCPSGQEFVCPLTGNAYCSSPKTSTAVNNESDALKNAIQKEVENRQIASSKKIA